MKGVPYVLYLVEVMLMQLSLLWYLKLCKIVEIQKFCYHGTVDSRYCGYPRDHGLVSVIARVCNVGVREKCLDIKGIYYILYLCCTLSPEPIILHCSFSI